MSGQPPVPPPTQPPTQPPVPANGQPGAQPNAQPSGPLAAFQRQFPDAVTGATADGTPFARVELAAVRAAALHLRDAMGYRCLRDLTAVDDPTRVDRFELNWLFYAMTPPGWFRLKTRTIAAAPSLVEVFPALNWYEREVFDLFGVRFDGHPELTRILMPDDWQGHPLRRDHPIGGEAVEFTVTRDVQR